MSEAAQNQVDKRGAPDAGTQCPTSEERVLASMQQMEGRIQSSMQQQIVERTQALMQQMQRMEERVHSSLQHHAEGSRGIDVDQVRPSEEEVRQQQGGTAVTPGRRVLNGSSATVCVLP
eukprot:GHVU01070145.1.p2 GENE.GHVU01070145.1~~GHVU01070145.1.p2  ORF type:complete len:126 (+),score=20.60 GHVU01070145.1:22-378(+)